MKENNFTQSARLLCDGSTHTHTRTNGYLSVRITLNDKNLKQQPNPFSSAKQHQQKKRAKFVKLKNWMGCVVG